MTGPYSPYGMPMTGAAAAPDKPGIIKAAAASVLLLGLLLAGGFLVNVALTDAETLMERMPPGQAADMQAQGIDGEQLRALTLGCGGVMGLFVVGIAILLAAFVWAGKGWAMITSIVLAGCLMLCCGLNGLFEMVLLVQPMDGAPAQASSVVVSLVTAFGAIASIVLLAMALRHRAKQQTVPPDAAYQAAWQQYYAHQQQMQQQSQQQQQPPPSS